MTIYRFIYLISILFLGSNLCAQDNLNWRVQLLDVETGQPLARAHAFNKSMGRVWTSDSEGWVTVEVNPLRNNEIEFS
ncbi:MAG: hypothetical protein ACI84C_002229, partial [Flavobacteriales bacterium]